MPSLRKRALPRIAVIIPAKNEAANLPGVIDDVARHLPEADIIVVDDHSDDGTAEAVSPLSRVTVLTSPISLGIGGAVQLGLRYAFSKGYDVFIRMDGDGQHRAESAKELLRVRAPLTLVQGSRPQADFTASSNRIRKFGSSYFQFLFRACTACRISDPTSGLMCFGRDIAEKFSRFYPSDFPEIESLVLLIRSGHRIVSAPVAMQPRKSGESSINPVYASVYMLSVTIAFFSSFVRKNPYGAAHAAA
jgi:glycosyltransferase involved in cell wall biosynthesis